MFVFYQIGYQEKERPSYTVATQLIDQDIKNNGSKTMVFEIGDKLPDEIGLLVSVNFPTGRDGLRGKIEKMGPHYEKKSSTRRTKEYQMIETTVVARSTLSYCSFFVLERKKRLNTDDAYMVVTLAHYFVTEVAGFSVKAKFHQKEDTIDFEVEGPIKHPRDDLSKVINHAWNTGVWSPSACSHCNGAKQTNNAKTMISHSSLKTATSHDGNKNVSSVISQHLYYHQGPVYYYKGNGNYTYSNSKVNSGANSGDSDIRRTNNNHGGNTFNNSGNFKGNGNGASIRSSDSSASTGNSRR
ncbi:hypothetical protein RIF29_15502 [Crotalaria pallida]|uniref:Uncharacterized protein n=1 Tax=Crotalaria pallida TaxID=3830 RepID=A0AAN9FFQ2_CROPI